MYLFLPPRNIYPQESNLTTTIKHWYTSIYKHIFASCNSIIVRFALRYNIVCKQYQQIKKTIKTDADKFGWKGLGVLCDPRPPLLYTSGLARKQHIVQVLVGRVEGLCNVWTRRPNSQPSLLYTRPVASGTKKTTIQIVVNRPLSDKHTLNDKHTLEW